MTTYDIYSSAAGPMNLQEMKAWLHGTRSRPLDDICLVAAGWHPESSEAKAYIIKEGGLAERIRAHAWDAENTGHIWIKDIDADGILQTEKNKFIEWLASAEVGNNPSCRLLVRAWKYYRLISPHPESPIHDAEQGAYMAVLAVQDDHPEITQANKALEIAIQDKTYKKFWPWLQFQSGPDEGEFLTLGVLASNVTRGKKKYLKANALIKNKIG